MGFVCDFPQVLQRLKASGFFITEAWSNNPFRFRSSELPSFLHYFGEKTGGGGTQANSSSFSELTLELNGSAYPNRWF